MADANAVLTTLARARSPLTTTELLLRVDAKADARKGRKALIANLAVLMRREFAQHAAPRSAQKAFGDLAPEGCWQITDAGRAFARSGEKIIGCGRGPRIREGGENEPAYAVLWKALRMAPDKRATLPALMESSDMDEASISHAREYMRALVKSGIVLKLRDREPGLAVTSPGLQRYALIKDLGPKAPLMRRRGLINPNNFNETIAPVAKKKEC